MIPTTFRCGIEKRHPAHDERTHVRTCLRAIVWGFVIETAEIGVSLLNLQLPIAFDFDLCYHANAELLDCPEL